MQAYKDLLEDIIKNGYDSDDRTGIGTRRVFDRTVRFNLSKGFPLLTLKKTYFKGAIQELLFFLKGGNNISQMPENIRHWWSAFADSGGNLGSATYGNSLRRFSYGGDEWDSYWQHDQLMSLVTQLKENPNSRRHIITSWHPALVENQGHLLELKEDAAYLPSCHLNYVQFFVQGNKLSASVTCRSQDFILGVPVNWAEHSALIHILANILNLEVGEYIWHGMDVHIYKNHFDAVEEILKRESFPQPQLKINRQLTTNDLDINNFTLVLEDFELSNYQYHPAIKAEMAV